MTAQVTIICDSAKLDQIGYDNCNMALNGEHLILKNFISEDDIVFDVGASVGEWSEAVLASRNVKMFAFEPLPTNFKILSTKKKFLNFHCFNYALSDQCGTADFFYYEKEAGLGNFFDRPILYGIVGKSKKTIVEMKTLPIACQEINISYINFLKIDTEGCEWKILKTSEDLLQNHQIAQIQFEYGGCYTDSHATLKETYELLRSHGYHIYRIYSKSLIYVPKWRDALENYKYSNYFASLQFLSLTNPI